MLTMIEHFNGAGPTNDEMRGAPVLSRWLLKVTRSGVEVHGIVHGHPHLPDGEWIRSSELVQIDPSSKPLWLRTENRLYHLGKRMGRTEIHIRKELQASGFALTRDQVTVYDRQEFFKVFRQRRKKLDEAERILLLLVRTNRVDRDRAIKLLKTLLTETSR